MGAGSGAPSATIQESARTPGLGGIGAGSGAPSATIQESARTPGLGGIGAGNGAPSASRVGLFREILVVTCLTVLTTGSTISNAKSEIPKTNEVFFMGETLQAAS